MRLFVALEVPKTAVDYMDRMQSQLKQEIKADRWQPLGNFHLTLHFLGEVQEDLVPALIQDIDMVSSIIAPFTLELGKFGVFPHGGKPRVLWLGLNGNRKSLEQLHLLLGKRFDMHQGLNYDDRPYRPHITLARGPQIPPDKALLELSERMLEEPAPRWEVHSVHLYRSLLRPDGAVHTMLHSARLGGEAGRG